MTSRSTPYLAIGLACAASLAAGAARAQAPVEPPDVRPQAAFVREAAPDEPPVEETRAQVRERVREEVYAPVVETPAGAPETPPRRARDDADPFAPPGIRVGAFRLFASIAQSLGFDTNPQRSPIAGKSEAFSRTEAEARIESDWTRHSFTGALRGGYDAYGRSSNASRPTLSGESALRLDIANDARLTLSTTLGLDTERPGARDLPGATVNRPAILDYSASAALERDVGPGRLGLRGTIGRTQYGEARLADGTRVSRRDRDLTRFEIAARAGYEINPGLIPFVEIAADRRLYDRRVNAAGLRRSSDGLTGRVGASFELTRLITGEASIGWQTRNIDDPTLRRLDGLVADASLDWALSPLTRLRLTASSRLDETTQAGASGDRTQTIGLSFAHDLRRNLTARGEIAFTHTRFGGGGEERAASGGVGLEYALGRFAVVGADWRRERLRDDLGGGYDADLYLVGLRVRH
ncbi:MAG: outer membrane beta-barrel protein [Microvirga sp.]|nr:outer membrane beta-barrel protein [Microvirga sp.]